MKSGVSRMKSGVSRMKSGLSQMDRVRNEEVRRRTGIEIELASRADQRVLKY